MSACKPSPLGSCPPTMYTSPAALQLAYPGRALGGALPDTAGVFSPAYAAQGYMPFGGDASAFYSPLNAENADAWRNFSAQTAAWAYDPSMVGYPYAASYGGLDVRRKNATRESTSTLKAWLYEHIKNPYPTKGEKIMLAIITKMTLTQVSTWFANARRRLKKENKMQWSPRNRTGDDDDDKNSDDDDDDIGRDDDNLARPSRDTACNGSRGVDDDDDEDIIVDAGNDDSQFALSDGCGLDMLHRSSSHAHNLSRHHKSVDDIIHVDRNGGTNSPNVVIGRVHGSDFENDDGVDSDSDVGASNSSRPRRLEGPSDERSISPAGRRTIVVSSCASSVADSTKNGSGGVVEKPRIWSLADVATSSKPRTSQNEVSSPTSTAPHPPPPPSNHNFASIVAANQNFVNKLANQNLANIIVANQNFANKMASAAVSSAGGGGGGSFQPWLNGGVYTAGGGLAAAYGGYGPLAHPALQAAAAAAAAAGCGIPRSQGPVNAAAAAVAVANAIHHQQQQAAHQYAQRLVANGLSPAAVGSKGDHSSANLPPGVSATFAQNMAAHCAAVTEAHTAFKPVTKRL